MTRFILFGSGFLWNLLLFPKPTEFVRQLVRPPFGAENNTEAGWTTACMSHSVNNRGCLMSASLVPSHVRISSTTKGSRALVANNFVGTRNQLTQINTKVWETPISCNDTDSLCSNERSGVHYQNNNRFSVFSTCMFFFITKKKCSNDIQVA